MRERVDQADLRLRAERTDEFGESVARRMVVSFTSEGWLRVRDGRAGEGSCLCEAGVSFVKAIGVVGVSLKVRATQVGEFERLGWFVQKVIIDFGLRDSRFVVRIAASLANEPNSARLIMVLFK